MNQNYC